jgi:adenylate kinase
MIISITGTPGTGKTTVSRILARQMDAKLVNLTGFIRKNRLSCGYDYQRKAMIVDTGILDKKVMEKLKSEKRPVILDGHLSHFIHADIAFVLRLDPKTLEKRLKKRRFGRKKVVENVQAEILDIIYAEAIENCKQVMQINATGKSPGQLAKRILNTLLSKKYKSDKVDWTRKFAYYIK